MNNTLVSNMTKDELIQLIRAELTNLSTPQEKTYYYGYNGLAEILGCSRANAANVKRSGQLDGAYTQIGRKIIWNREKVLELAGKRKGGRK